MRLTGQCVVELHWTYQRSSRPRTRTQCRNLAELLPSLDARDHGSGIFVLPHWYTTVRVHLTEIVLPASQTWFRGRRGKGMPLLDSTLPLERLLWLCAPPVYVVFVQRSVQLEPVSAQVWRKNVVAIVEIWPLLKYISQQPVPRRAHLVKRSC